MSVFDRKPSRRAFLGVAGLAPFALGGPEKGRAAHAHPEPRSPQERALRVQTSPLAGFQFHDGERLWPRLRVGQPLELVREPDDPFDDLAVRVDWSDRKLGYVPRGDNLAVATMLDEGERLDTTSTDLSDSPNPWDRVEPTVHLALPT